MTACHYTPSQIDDLEMLDVIDLFRYWSKWPPTHEILAQVHRVRPAHEEKPEIPANADDPSGIGGMIASSPNGFVKATR